MGKLTRKVAIVTGASKGIGAGIAKGLAAAGASVVVNYSSSKPGADRVVDEIRKGGKAIGVQGDVSKSADIGAASTRPVRHSAHWTCSLIMPESSSSRLWRTSLRRSFTGN